MNDKERIAALEAFVGGILDVTAGAAYPEEYEEGPEKEAYTLGCLIGRKVHLTAGESAFLDKLAPA